MACRHADRHLQRYPPVIQKAWASHFDPHHVPTLPHSSHPSLPVATRWPSCPSQSTHWMSSPAPCAALMTVAGVSPAREGKSDMHGQNLAYRQKADAAAHWMSSPAPCAALMTVAGWSPAGKKKSGMHSQGLPVHTLDVQPRPLRLLDSSGSSVACGGGEKVMGRGYTSSVWHATIFLPLPVTPLPLS